MARLLAAWLLALLLARASATPLHKSLQYSASRMVPSPLELAEVHEHRASGRLRRDLSHNDIRLSTRYTSSKISWTFSEAQEIVMRSSKATHLSLSHGVEEIVERQRLLPSSQFTGRRLEARRRNKGHRGNYSAKDEGGHDADGDYGDYGEEGEFDDGSWRGDEGDYGGKWPKTKAGDSGTDDDVMEEDGGGDSDAYRDSGQHSWHASKNDADTDRRDEQDLAPEGGSGDRNGASDHSQGDSSESDSAWQWKPPGSQAKVATHEDITDASGWHHTDSSETEETVSQDGRQAKADKEYFDSEEGDPSNDCAALARLYRDMDGPSWERRQGWDTASESDSPFSKCCQAVGVDCDAEDRVIAVDLASNGLSGSLSSAIFDLTALERLNLSSNAISGYLPDSFQSLSKLATVYLGSNKLEGVLPASLQQLPDLSTLHISNNSLGGMLYFPQAWNLTQLYASRNHFTYINITSNPALVKIALDDNRFNCTLPDVTNLTQLQLFTAARNTFTGTPPDVSKLAKLVKLNLQDNVLSGSFPDVSGLDNLEYMALNGNGNLSGPFPTGPAPASLQKCRIDTLLASSCPPKSVLADKSSLASKCSITCRGGGKPANAIHDASPDSKAAALQPEVEQGTPMPANMESETAQTPASLIASMSGSSRSILPSGAACSGVVAVFATLAVWM